MAVRDAPVDEIEEAIRPGGISKVKSARIKSILRAITDTAPGGGAVAGLAGWPASHGGPGLPHVPARGRAARPPRACCCSRSGCATCPSTPMSRASGRGSALFRPGARSTRSTTRCSQITPPGEELEFHLNLLRHGRRTCHARRPGLRGLRAPAECARARFTVAVRLGRVVRGVGAPPGGRAPAPVTSNARRGTYTGHSGTLERRPASIRCSEGGTLPECADADASARRGWVEAVRGRAALAPDPVAANAGGRPPGRPGCLPPTQICYHPA